jgi:ferredoxin-NADP reductase
MANPASPAGPRAAGRDHGFHRLRIRDVVHETADASTFVLDIPDELEGLFAYEPGQFCTFRAEVDGEVHLRCYSMCSTPGVDPELAVTVKRVPGGIVSNWMHDTLAAGDEIDVTAPTGVFTLHPDAGVVAFAGGSGITPVFSLMKSALATTEHPVRLLYANRDRGSVIFDEALGKLSDDHGDRVEIIHHLDDDAGYLHADAIRALLAESPDSHFYLCGPVPFMDLVEHTMLESGIEPGRIHLERFGSPPTIDPGDQIEAEAAVDDDSPAKVTIEIAGKSATADHHPGTTILQTARQLGLNPPFSCESGSCATCMARLTEGTVTMYVNNALDDDEVEEGWILTCQSVPTSPTAHVIYEDN